MVEIGKNEDWSKRERLEEVWVQDRDRVVGVEDNEQHIYDANYQGCAQEHLSKKTMKIGSTGEKEGRTSLMDKIRMLLWDLSKGWLK